MSDDIKNKPEGPAQEPQRCPCCNSYCSCPCHDATAAPSYPSELPASKLSWPQLPEPSARAVEAARRIIHFFRANPRVMRETVVGRIIDDVFESAPSQPAGAREFEQHTKAVSEFLNELYATMVDPCEQPQMTVAEMCDLLIKTAREHREIANSYAQQTAAKDAALVAAERERDSYKEALQFYVDQWFDKGTPRLRLTANCVEAYKRAKAALKAGKDGQK